MLQNAWGSVLTRPAEVGGSDGLQPIGFSHASSQNFMKLGKGLLFFVYGLLFLLLPLFHVFVFKDGATLLIVTFLACSSHRPA